MSIYSNACRFSGQLFRIGAWKKLGLACLSIWLTACSSGQVLVDKTDFAAAEQCLLTQQNASRRLAVQDQQLLETLQLLRQTLEQQRRGFELDELVQAVRTGIAEAPKQQDCPVDVPEVTAMAADKLIVGRQERVLMTDLGFIVQGRVDTGAATSSMDARNIEIFERNSEDWVRFEIHNPDTDSFIELERKRVRVVLITQSNSEEPDRRPVVEMRVTLGNVTQMAEFTLTNRSHLEYQLLVGRNILQDLMLVDVAQSNLLQPAPPESPDNGRENSE